MIYLFKVEQDVNTEMEKLEELEGKLDSIESKLSTVNKGLHDESKRLDESDRYGCTLFNCINLRHNRH